MVWQLKNDKRMIILPFLMKKKKKKRKISLFTSIVTKFDPLQTLVEIFDAQRISFLTDRNLFSCKTLNISL